MCGVGPWAVRPPSSTVDRPCPSHPQIPLTPPLMSWPIPRDSLPHRAVFRRGLSVRRMRRSWASFSRSPAKLPISTPSIVPALPCGLFPMPLTRWSPIPRPHRPVPTGVLGIEKSHWPQPSGPMPITSPATMPRVRRMIFRDATAPSTTISAVRWMPLCPAFWAHSAHPKNGREVPPPSRRTRSARWSSTTSAPASIWPIPPRVHRQT